MPTVSDIKFVPLARGACPDCGRHGLELGRVSPDYPGADILRCIDCHFGPPLDLWEECPNCGYPQPGDVCAKCGTIIRGALP